jgi:rhodanese-related sulfurtransferase
MKFIAVLFFTAIILSTAFNRCSVGNKHTVNQDGYINIDAAAFEKIRKKEKALIIDVRTPEEVSAGYIAGTTLFADIQSGDFEQKINVLDKSKAYIVYCRSGGRSARAADYMVKKGFSRVYNLTGGIQNWKGEIVKP